MGRLDLRGDSQSGDGGLNSDSFCSFNLGARSEKQTFFSLSVVTKLDVSPTWANCDRDSGERCHGEGAGPCGALRPHSLWTPEGGQAMHPSCGTQQVMEGGVFSLLSYR